MECTDKRRNARERVSRESKGWAEARSRRWEGREEGPSSGDLLREKGRTIRRWRRVLPHCR